MKSTIRDAKSLGALRPLDVVGYLRAGGWDESGEGTATWTREFGSETFELLVPIDPQVGDFAVRMSEVLQTLEVCERRPQTEILRDLQTSSSDVVRVRLIDSELNDGSVPLPEGAQFVEGAKDMMLAAACATVSPRSYFPSRRPDVANEFLRKARLGQTEQGSFVITIQSRVTPALKDGTGQLFDAAEPPFERRVIQTLTRSLGLLSEASERAATRGEVQAFVDGVKHGISANLCEAIVGMGTCVEDERALEISVSWAPTRPVDARESLPSRIFIPPDRYPVLREAATYFKEKVPRENFEVFGTVVKLERAEGAPVGRVTVFCQVDEQPRKVLVGLADSDYRLASTAHIDGNPVSCAGTLVREGRSLRLESPYGFRVVEE